MTLKFIVDMNLSPQWIEVLRQQGWKAIHWSTVGSATADDNTIMNWALANRSIVFTHDLDFSAILAATQAKAPSVLQLRTQDILPEALAQTVIAAIRQFEYLLAQGALVVVDPRKSRARILPIHRSS